MFFDPRILSVLLHFRGFPRYLYFHVQANFRFVKFLCSVIFIHVANIFSSLNATVNSQLI